MAQREQALLTFQTRVRQLILQFQKLKQENEELYAELEADEERIKELEAKVASAERDYNALKMARMIQITDGDLEGAKDRLAHLIREINKCIAVLSGDK